MQIFLKGVSWQFLLFSGAAISDKKKLMKDLKSHMDKDIRPVLDEDTPTNVTLGIELIQLLKVVRFSDF